MASNAQLEISNLIHRYFRYMDAARFDELGELFAHARFNVPTLEGDIVHDAAAITDIYAKSVQMYDESGNLATAGTGRTHHAGQNLILEFEDDDHATAWSTAVVLQQTAAFPLQPIASVTYDDRFERVDGKWRFCARAIRVRLPGDMTHHVSQQVLYPSNAPMA